MWLQMLANGLGLLVVTLYFRYLFPASIEDELGDRSPQRDRVRGLRCAMVVIGLPINAALLHRAVSWAREQRQPSPRERRLLFGLPTVETLTALVSWLVASVIFGWLNTDMQRGRLRDRTRRRGHLHDAVPAAGRATSGPSTPSPSAAPNCRRTVEDVGPRLMLAWLLGSGVPLIALALSNRISPVPLSSQRLAWVAGMSMLAGGTVMWLAAAARWPAPSSGSATGCGASSRATSTTSCPSTTSASSAGWPRA